MHFLRFSAFFDCTDNTLDHAKLALVQRLKHNVDPLHGCFIGSSFGVKELIHGDPEHSRKLIEHTKARMLTIIFVVHNGTGIAVNDGGQLLLCQTPALSGPLDGRPYIVKI